MIRRVLTRLVFFAAFMGTLSPRAIGAADPAGAARANAGPQLAGRSFAVPDGCEIKALSGGALVQCTGAIFGWRKVPDGTDDLTDTLVKPFRSQGLAESAAGCAVEGVPVRCRVLRTVDRKPPAVYAGQAAVRGERVAVLCVDGRAGRKLPPVCASALSVAAADIKVAQAAPWSWSIERIAAWVGLALGALIGLSWRFSSRGSD